VPAGKVSVPMVTAHAAERDATEHLDGGDRIALLLRNEIGVRRLLPAERDLIASRLVAIEEQRVLVLRGELEHRQRRRFHVVHRIPQPPGSRRPWARVQALRPQFAHGVREVVDRVFVGRRVLEERRLGPERRDVLEVRGIVHVPWIPGVERGAHVRGADLAVLFEPLRDGHPDHVHFARHEVRRVGADRLREGRQPDAGRKRAGLMVDVDDLRLPLPPRVLEHARLDHVQHVGVTVVVVPDVLLIQPRQP